MDETSFDAVRMWHTLTTGQFVAKDVAAAWAIPLLPVGTAALVVYAKDAYLAPCQMIGGLGSARRYEQLAT